MGISEKYTIILDERVARIIVAEDHAREISELLNRAKVLHNISETAIEVHLLGTADVQSFITFLETNQSMIDNPQQCIFDVKKLMPSAPPFELPVLPIKASAPPVSDFPYYFTFDSAKNELTLYSSIPGIFRITRGTSQWVKAGANIVFTQDMSAFTANLNNSVQLESLKTFVRSKSAFIENAADLHACLNRNGNAPTGASFHVSYPLPKTPQKAFYNMTNKEKYNVITGHAGWHAPTMQGSVKELDKLLHDNNWTCPISEEVMNDPRVLPSGQTVDIDSLKDRKNNLDPFDNTRTLPDRCNDLVVNLSVKSAISSKLDATYQALESAVNASKSGVFHSKV